MKFILTTCSTINMEICSDIIRAKYPTVKTILHTPQNHICMEESDFYENGDIDESFHDLARATGGAKRTLNGKKKSYSHIIIPKKERIIET